MDHSGELAERIAETAQRNQLQVAVAESLTGGLLANRLAAAPAAAEWFAGAVVAYSRRVKHAVLGVPAGPVVSEAAALAMADTVAKLLNAQASVAVTGVGGPQRQDGQAPGTVWVAVCHGTQIHATLHHFIDSDPAAVCDRACTQALGALLAALSPSRQ